jgi:hypothetical protein
MWSFVAVWIQKCQSFTEGDAGIGDAHQDAGEVRYRGIFETVRSDERVDDAAVGDHEQRSTRTGTTDRIEGLEHTGDDRVGCFEAFGSATIIQEAWPSFIDLDIGQSRPLADIAFAQSLIDQHRSDAELLSDDRGCLRSAQQIARNDAVDRTD